MANALYDNGRESFLRGEISWQGDNIKVALVDSALYTPNLSTDQFLSDVPLSSRTATSANLTTKTTTDGVADADDVTLASVTGNQSEYLVVFQDTGVEGTSRLIAFIDTATGLPVTPNGGDISIQWDAGADRIFKL